MVTLSGVNLQPANKEIFTIDFLFDVLDKQKQYVYF